MGTGVLIQLAGSFAAVMLLVALAAWARLARPTPPLGEDRVRSVMGEEFPGRGIDGLWIADDGRGAIARSGGEALVLFQAGDTYVARSLPWSLAVSAPRKEGVLNLTFDDVAAPRTRLVFAGWPPQEAAA